MSINRISSQTLNPAQTQNTQSSQGSRDAKIEQLLEEIEQLLMGDDGGDDSSIGGNGNTNGNSSGNVNGNTPPLAGKTQEPSSAPTGGAPGQGLHDIKLNTKAGGEALHLKEDSQGNLYNGSGNSVGVIDKNGNVTLNSGATKERERLETGNKSFMGMPIGGGPSGKEGAGGNVEYSANDVTVSAGDLDQKADF
ncbi:hypothetical protein [Burkholderia alba]|uniref:hypothetical protein n=1 Tax=Burkholderia alba TaxID=2683677 RepID=UPI00389949BC